MKISKELIIGLVTIATIVVAYMGVKFVKGNNPFSLGYTVYAEYDNLSNLQVGNSVLLSGKKIGQVKNAVFAQKDKPVITVEMLINTDFPIPKNSKAVIVSAGVMGPMAVDIKLGDSKELLEEGNVLLSDIEKGMLDGVMAEINPIASKGEKVIENLDKTLLEFELLAKNVNALLDKQKLNETIDNLNGLMRSFKKTSNTANTALTEVTEISKNVSADLESMNLKELSDKIKALVDNSNKMLETLNTEDGSLNKLMKDPKLYDNLDASTKELELLLRDLRENPKRYMHFSVFGRKDKKKEK